MTGKFLTVETMERNWTSISDYFNNRKSILVITAGILFTIHFLVSWIYSSPELDPNVITVFVEPLMELSSIDSVAYIPQVNYYTGNFFLLWPIVELAGYRPTIFRAVMIFFMALSSVFIFLGIEKRFGYNPAVISVLFLFNTGTWITFRFVDYTYVILCTSVLLYLYVLWDETSKPVYFYLFAFFAGLFFYFKVIIAYIVIGLTLGTLAKYGSKIQKIFNLRMLLIGSLMFLVGISPFLLMSIGTGFEWYEDVVTLEDNYEEERSVFELAEIRSSEFSSILRPHTYVRGNYRFFDFNASLIIILLGLMLTVFYRGYLVFSVSLTTVFLLLFYVTSVMTFRQSMVLIPISAFIAGGLIDRIKSRYVLNMLVLVLALSFVLFVTNLPEHYDKNFPSDHKHAINSTQYSHYQELNLGKNIVTNHNIVYYLSKYDQETNEYYVTEEKIKVDSEGDVAAMREGRIHIDELETDFGDEKTSFVLNKEECAKSVRVCGVKTSTLQEKFDLNSPKPVKISGKDYLLYK